MNSYVNYLLEANIGLVLFLAAYTLIIGKETTFRLQRLFLITGILGSLLFPLFHISNASSQIPSLSTLLPSYLLPEITIVDQSNSATGFSQTQNITIGQAIEILYLSGLVIFLIRFLIQILHLVNKIRSSRFSVFGKYNIAESTDQSITFSFFNFIFLGNGEVLSENEKQKIVLHETVHARELHSFDVLLVNAISIFCWFNPVLKFYKKIFIQLHEFEADARAVENRDVDAYCNLLAKVALQSADFRLASHFNNSLTLKRIKMMRTLKHKIKTWKVITIASVIPLMFFILACQDQVMNDITEIAKNTSNALVVPDDIQARYETLKKQNPNSNYVLVELNEAAEKQLAEMVTINDSQGEIVLSREAAEKRLAGVESKFGVPKHIEFFTPNASPGVVKTYAIIEYNDLMDDISNRSKLDDDVFTIVEETATPTTGIPGFYEYIGKNLKYPLEAREKGIEGKVLVEFIVDIDGTVNVTGVSGLGAGCDLEAMRVMQSSPKWIPGKNNGVVVKQQLILPITFRLSGSDLKGQLKTPTDAMDETVVVGHRSN